MTAWQAVPVLVGSSAWRLVRVAGIAAAAVVLAWTAAHWVWRWWGPETSLPVPTPSAAATLAPTIAATHWFGEPPQAQQTATTPVPGPRGQGQLLGIVAAPEGNGYAVFRSGDRGVVLARRGDEIASGLRIESIQAGSITVRDAAGAREILLRPSLEQTAPDAARTNRTAAAKGPVGMVSTRCVLPAGVPAYRLNAELLAGLAAQPGSWNSAVRPVDGGLLLREGNAFASLLGMQPGDRITQANGVPLRSADDVLGALIRPLMRNQLVRVAGARDGAAREWVFVNAGACPS